MTRKDILEKYTVNVHGIICSPGKFQGEMLYAPYFYDLMLNGSGDHVNGVDYFVVDEADCLEFPELNGAYGVALEESDAGFVDVTEIPEQKDFEADKLNQSRWGNTEG